jgi:hypothetical protein
MLHQDAACIRLSGVRPVAAGASMQQKAWILQDARVVLAQIAESIMKEVIK